MKKVEITKTSKKVKLILSKLPECQDDDNRLTAKFWRKELAGMGLDPFNITGSDLLAVLANGELTSSESIRRSRQRIQELNPNLRGKNYSERQKNQTDIKKQLK
jgi:hypothetical protein